MPDSLPILVVDDEPGLRHMLRLLLEREGHVVFEAEQGKQALSCLHEHPEVVAVFSDIRMPEMGGLELLEQLGAGDLFVVMMSAFGTTDTAVEALAKGAYDYINKPFRPAEIIRCVERIAETLNLRQENQRLRQEPVDPLGLFIGGSAGAEEVRALARKVAVYDTTVLITGESGTGKELIARGIHGCSRRVGGPFVAINCGAIPESLLESQLFGHEKGAFTGAHRARAGLFEEAHGGTLFLDEIGDMPTPLQVRLLRVLEDGRLRRLGSDHEIAVDVRVLAATAQDLETAVAEGSFRKDLFFRLNVVRVQVPPLRSRQADLHALSASLLQSIAKRLGHPAPRLGPSAHEALLGHSWPGNVRELKNSLEHAVVVVRGDCIEAIDLPPSMVAEKAQQDVFQVEGLSIKENGARLERSLIQQALERTGGNRTQASKLLEISYKALVYKIRDYGLE